MKLVVRASAFWAKPVVRGLLIGWWIAGLMFGAWLATRSSPDDYPSGLGSNMSGTPYGDGTTVGHP